MFFPRFEKMAEDDDDVIFYCRCPAVFDADFNLSVQHVTSCPYFFTPSLSEENWLLVRDQRNRFNDLVDDAVGEYVLNSIPVNFELQRALNEYRRTQLVDSSVQIGRGNNLLQFNFLDRVVKKSLHGGVHFRISRINIVDRATEKVKLNTKMRDLLGSLGQIFHKVIAEAKEEAKKGDRIQLIVSTEKSPASEDDTGMAYPIATPFFSVEDVEESMVIPFLFRYFKKYEHVTVGDQLVIETVLIRSAANMSEEDEEEILNGSDEGIDFLNSLQALKKKKGVVRIKNIDKMCLTRAVVVCLFYNDMGKFNADEMETDNYKYACDSYEAVRHGDDSNPFQKRYAKLLCDFSEICSSKPTNDKDIQKVASFLKVEIKIVNFETMKVEKKIGRDINGKIYLLRRKIYNGTDPMDPLFFSKFIFHFDAIISMERLLGKKRFCHTCDIGFDDIQSHKCKDKIKSWCFACYDRNCVGNEKDRQKCPSCEVIVIGGKKCLKRHKELNICHLFWCARCHKKLLKKRLVSGKFESLADARKRHKCEVLCNLCGRQKKDVHKCYMLRKPFNKPCLKLLFFDFETDQSLGSHLPVFCYIKWIEFNEKDEIVLEDEKEFGVNYLVFKQVGDFLFSEQFRDYTFIAHNMKGFDGCFLLRYLLLEGIFVSTIANGQKINSMDVPSLNIRVIDSLNFLQMPLASLPAAMGVENVVKAKGFFPHFFTSPATLNYIGPLPDPEFFGCFDMKDKSYCKFMLWYEAEQKQNPVFDFQKSMRLYCIQDVEILKAGCLKFRELVMDVTKNIVKQPDELPDEAAAVLERKCCIDSSVDDVFEGQISDKKSDCFDEEGVCDPFSYISIPGMCSAIFKAKFLKKNSIAQVLPAGYENFKHSLVACEYIEFLRRTKYFDILYALNTHDGKEVCLLNGKYRVDGFVPSKNIVVEFYGCFWHGCPDCIKNMQDIHPVRKVSYESLLSDTLEREARLKDAGFVVETIWECQWEKMKKEENVCQEVKTIHIKTRLHPRKGFQGGRTETRLLKYDIKTSKYGKGLAYDDICSLYPTVNCKDFYPVGHPKIITSNFEHFSKYFGLIQCKVAPPKNLTNGVLPLHVNGKLMFPLCRTCAENQQIEVCRHSQEERSLYGIWVSEELKQAEENGYKVLQIFCVHHFERKSKDLFANYIKTFFKHKLLASERPPEETDEELDKFIEEVKKFEGIDLQKEDFKFNPGLRSVCKLCCNCFWGRLGMRDVFTNVDFIREVCEFHAIANNSTKEISTVRFVTPHVVAVLSKNKSLDTVNFTNNTNVYLAVFTTAYARIRLYNLIKKVEDRFVYCDTDSVFYEISSDGSKNLKTGKFMGDLTSELKKDEVITEFVSGGPKVYAYKTNQGSCVVKIKGFQLCKANSAAFSFENLKNIISTYVAKNIDLISNRVKHKPVDGSIRQTIFNNSHQVCPTKSSAVATNDAISSYNPNRIKRSLTWEILRSAEQKIYTFNFDKRVVLGDFHAVPFGFVGE